MNRLFERFYQLINILIVFMQVILPLFFIIYNSIHQNLYEMKKMAILFIVIEILSILFLVFSKRLFSFVNRKYYN